MTSRSLVLVFIVTALCNSVFAQQKPADHKQMVGIVESHAQEFKDVSKEIWGYAELGYHENKSSRALQEMLKKVGFNVQAGVAGEPTGFIASFGHGKPVIAVL